MEFPFFIPSWNIVLFGHEITVYGLAVFVGILLCSISVIILSRLQKVKLDDSIFVMVFGMFGMFLGSKIMYLLENLPLIVKFYSQNGFSSEFTLRILTGGFVMYGGLFGALAGTAFTIRLYKLDKVKIYKIAMPSVAVFAACGRVGCLFTGCCHGVETACHIAVVYSDSPYAPAGVNLVPVQLYEILFDILLGMLMIVLCRSKLSLPRVYLALYAVFRFILEFFRGDSARGVYWGISFSQIISVLILAYLAAEYIIRSRKERHKITEAV